MGIQAASKREAQNVPEMSWNQKSIDFDTGIWVAHIIVRLNTCKYRVHLYLEFKHGSGIPS